MLNCREATALCSQELERPLRMGERVSLGTHVLICSGCSNFRKQMQTLRWVAKSYADGEAPVSQAAEGKRD